MVDSPEQVQLDCPDASRRLGTELYCPIGTNLMFMMHAQSLIMSTSARGHTEQSSSAG